MKALIPAAGLGQPLSARYEGSTQGNASCGRPSGYPICC